MFTKIKDKYYVFSGSFQFSLPNIENLDWRDTIRDNHGTGQFLYVNLCSDCGKKYLRSTVIYIKEPGLCCEKIRK